MLLRWTKPYYPYYFFKAQDVPEKFLTKGASSGQQQQYDIVVDGRTAKNAVTKYVDGDLKGLVYIEFDTVDAWFEEEEQIFVHPKDPYKVCPAPVYCTAKY